jgi:predicted thioesterase
LTALHAEREGIAMPIAIGTTGRATLTVGVADLATALYQELGDEFPPVFATARLVGLMELAASRALHPLLAPGEASVGVRVDVAHTAATPLGAVVTAEARVTGIDGKQFVFDVVAHDAGGEVGRGTHRRAIVAAERLAAGAQRRCTAGG